MSREVPKVRKNYTLEKDQIERLEVLARDTDGNASEMLGKLIDEETERRRASHARKG